MSSIYRKVKSVFTPRCRNRGGPVRLAGTAQTDDPVHSPGEGISYYGMTPQKKFEQIETYCPKLVENITQAISRDILTYAIKTLRNERIVGHVHDEIILEAEKDASVQDICEQMGRTPAWISGLVLRADGYECEYYRKD